MVDSLSNIINKLDDNKKNFLATKDETYYIGFYNKVTELSSWEKEIVIGDIKYLLPQIQDLKLISQLEEKLKTSKKEIEYSRLAGTSEATLAEMSAASNILSIEIIKSVSAIQDFNRNLIKTSNDNKLVVAKSKNIWVNLISILLLGLLFVTGYLVMKYLKDSKDTESLLRYNSSLIKNISDPVITTNSAYLITNWNNFAYQLFGYTEEEALGKHLGNFLKIEYSHTVMPEMMEFFITEKDWRGEAICYHKNGNRIEVEISSSIIKEGNNKNNGIIVVIRNITEHKHLTQKLESFSEDLQQQVKEKSKELTIVFDRVADGFIACDNEWRYTYLNPKAAELYDKTADELLGTRLISSIDNEGSSELFQAMVRAKKTQQTERVEIYNSKMKVWFDAMIYPSPDGTSVYFRDITERMESQEKLQKVHERLQYYMQRTPFAVIEMDSDRNIILWNRKAEEMFGWKADEILGKSPEEINIFHEEDLSKGEEFVKGFTSTDNKIAKYKNYTRNGDVILCQWYNSVLKDDHGNVIGTMSLAEDITQKTEIENELQEAEGKFRSLVEKSILGVYIIQDEKLVYVNPNFAKIFEYDTSEFLDFDHIMIVHPTDREKVAENIRSRIRQDVNSINYQFKGITKHGKAIYVEVFGSFTVYKGKPSIIGSIIDVTQRIHFIEQLEKNRQAEKLLNERFLLAAKATKDAVWDWDMITNKIWGNRTFCDFMGVDDLDSFKTEDFFHRVHPEDKAMLLQNLKYALKNKISLQEEEFRYHTVDGKNIIIHDKAYIIYDEKNRGVRMVGAFHDITEQKQAEQKLVIEKELSDSIINSLPGIFYLINSKGLLVRWNKNFEKVTLYRPSELINFNMRGLFSADKQDEMTEKVTRIFAGGEDNIESRIILKDGTSVDFQLSGNRISLDGESCLIGVGIDVSERTKIQKELRTSEEKFRMLIEQASDGIFISDKNGDLVDVNTSMSTLTGYTKNQLLRMNSRDILLKNKASEANKVQNLNMGESVIIENRLRKTNQEYCNVEVSYKLLHDGSYQGIVRDITSRKEAEEALRVSENNYRILFDKNPLPMFILSTTTQKFLDVNTAAINFYGYSKDEFMQKNLFDLMSSEGNPIVLKNFGALIRNIQKGGVYHHFKKSGDKVNINTIIHDIVYHEQSAKLIVASDETEKIAAEESLKQSHESLRQLATHLESVREAERTHMAREIHDELGQQLTGLKMDISWIAKKLHVEDRMVAQKMVDVKALIDKTVVTVRRLATELRPSILDDLGLVSAMEWQSEEFQKRSEITSHFTTNDPAVVVNNETATNIFRIFQESLTNVFRHSNATEVVSKLSTQNDELELEIKDNGQGFNLATIESKKTLGILGMKERVHIMGGSYNIFSKPGHGTIIKILVPLHKEVN